MNGILHNYLPLVVFIGIASVIGLALLIAPFLVAYQQPDPEKAVRLLNADSTLLTMRA